MAISISIVLSLEFPFGASDVQEKTDALQNLAIETSKELFATAELLAEKYHPKIEVNKHDTIAGRKVTVYEVRGG